MGHTWKNGLHLQKWVRLKKWVTDAKIGLTYKKVSQLKKMGRTWKNGSHVEKRFTLGKTGHIYKKKWLKLKQIGHTTKN